MALRARPGRHLIDPARRARSLQPPRWVQDDRCNASLFCKVPTASEARSRAGLMYELSYHFPRSYFFIFFLGAFSSL